jgi:uncharacterized protein (DUF2141 family)
MIVKRLALHLAAICLGLAAANLEAKAGNYDLTVEVSGLRNYNGQVVIVLWPGSSEASKFPYFTQIQLRDEHTPDTECDFQKYSICRRMIGNLQNLTTAYTFKAVPPGDYAVFVFHDENNNTILDTGILNRPLEGRGFSAVLPEQIKPFQRKVTFKRAKFVLDGEKTITVGLRYPPPR